MTGLEAARGAYGLAVVVAGPAIGAVVAGRPLSRGEALVVRVLGARHVVQALVARTRPVAELAVLVDAAHAASLVGFAVFDRRHRRLALADLPAATAFTLAEGIKRA